MIINIAQKTESVSMEALAGIRRGRVCHPTHEDDAVHNDEVYVEERFLITPISCGTSAMFSSERVIAAVNADDHRLFVHSGGYKDKTTSRAINALIEQYGVKLTPMWDIVVAGKTVPVVDGMMIDMRNGNIVETSYHVRQSDINKEAKRKKALVRVADYWAEHILDIGASGIEPPKDFTTIPPESPEQMENNARDLMWVPELVRVALESCGMTDTNKNRALCLKRYIRGSMGLPVMF